MLELLADLAFANMTVFTKMVSKIHSIFKMMQLAVHEHPSPLLDADYTADIILLCQKVCECGCRDKSFLILLYVIQHLLLSVKKDVQLEEILTCFVVLSDIEKGERFHMLCSGSWVKTVVEQLGRN